MSKKKEKKSAPKKNAHSLQEQKVSVPAAYGSIMRVGQPVINGGNSIVIRHTEYLDDINSLASFSIDPAVQVYALNPGLTTSFPWLGNMAAGYEQYRFKKLIFRYRARIGTGTGGSVYYSTQLDSNDPDFGSKEEMYAYSGTQSTTPWLDMAHNCLLSRGDYLKKYFIRTGELAADDDSQLYDSGKFTFVPIASSAGLYLGELLVDYEVELFNPKMNVADVGAGADFVSQGSGTYNTPFTGTILKALWGAADFVGITDNKTITWQQPGLYQVSMSFDATTSLSGSPGYTITGDAATASVYKVYGGGTDLASMVFWILVGLAGTAIVVTAGTAGAGVFTAVKITSAPLALAASLGAFSVSDKETLNRLNRRFQKRKIRFVVAGEGKDVLEQKVRRDRIPIRNEQPEPLRAQIGLRSELREDHIQADWQSALSRGQSPQRGVK